MMDHPVGTIRRILGAGALAVILMAEPVPAQEPVAPQAAPEAPRAAVIGDSYSPRLRIYYNWVPYGQTWGARLSQYPAPGSPLRQIQLEPGDLIYALDGQWLRTPQNLETHIDQTSVDFVNIRTNRPQRGFVFIRRRPNPPQPPFPPTPPPPAPPSYVLGVNAVPVPAQTGAAATVPGSGHQVFRPSYGLRITSVTPGSAAAQAGLEVGDTILTANNVSTGTIADLQQALANSQGFVRLTIRDVRTGNYVTVNANPTPVGGPTYAAPAAPPAPAPTAP